VIHKNHGQAASKQNQREGFQLFQKAHEVPVVRKNLCDRLLGAM
jgi:hypothetical protein